jgi:sugar phosphate isomerase/epimerase
MASNENVSINIDSKADLKGFKQAESAASKLGKTVKGLAATLGIAYGAKAVVQFGKAAAEAFMEDQKQAAKLANVVKNLGLQFENPAIASYIDKLTLASGVSDSQLRPALQALLTTTGDVAKSQELLSQAIDISAGSGVELNTVAQDLANGYVGITKGLKKYNLGLTAAEIKSAKFVDIQKKLIDTYKGSNAAYLDTYAGKMQLLSTAAGEAQEVIGGALIKSLMDFTGAIDATDLATKIGSWSKAIATFIDDFTWGFKKLAFLTSDQALLSGLNPFSNYIEKGIAKIDAERAAAEWRSAIAGSLGYDPMNNSLTGYKKDKAAKDKAARDAAARAKELAKTTAKNTAELKKQNALKKDSGVFDMQQIQLIAALKGQLSDDDRKRAELQLALLNGNLEEADKLTKQILMAQDATGNLYRYFLQVPDAKNPFAYLDTYLDYLQKKMNSLQFPDLSKPSTYTGAGMDPTLAALGVVAGYGANIPQTGSASTVASNAVLNGLAGMQSTSGFVSTQSVTGSNVQVYVQGSVVTEQELIDAIQAGLQSNSLSGAPSQIGRIAGMFG